jgi:phosphate-selective porin OprO/OprP
MSSPTYPSVALGVLTLIAAPAAWSATPQSSSTRALDEVWSLVELYNNPANPVVQRFALTGRLQLDYALIDGRGDPAPGITDEDLDFDFGGLRRLRAGFKANIFEKFTVQVETDLDPNEDPVYRRLTDANIAWKPSEAFELKLGKQDIGFTLDGTTSSRELLTIDRNNVTNNLAFTTRYLPGLSAGGTVNGWNYHAGVFSQGRSDGEFGDFDAGTSWLVSLGRDLSDLTGGAKADVRLDYVFNEETPTADLFTNRALGHIVSLNGRFEMDDFGVRADLTAGDGYLGQPDLWGFVVMPYYNFSAKLQGVLRYTYVHSDGPDGIRFTRYEAQALNDLRGDEYQEAYAGLNYYLYGHKLKLQTGVQYTTMRDRADNGGAFDGWSWTSGLRISW